MKYILLVAFLISLFSQADDIEIYGATAIDPANRVNSNVLFIMEPLAAWVEKLTSS